MLELKINKKYCIIFLGFLLIVNLILPLLLEFADYSTKTNILSILGNVLTITAIVVTIIDIVYLIFYKRNILFLSFSTMILCISIFLLLEYCFIRGLYNFHYVWSYSEESLSIIYKLVAIWAGQSGSVLTWIVFNSIVITFYRINNFDEEDIILLRSTIILVFTTTVFLIILFFMTPFEIKIPVSYLNGKGLSDLLRSPFMIWHPLFIFIAYAVFLIPFTVTISEFISPKNTFKNSYQKRYYNFTLKFGWFVITLGIALGAYWAKLTENWGAVYWSWDPVEGVSLIPWFLATAFFHSRVFTKKNDKLIKVNILLIFLSIIFSTFITRGGGFNSLHSFTGDEDLVIIVAFIGSIILILSLYVIYNLLNYIIEEYRDKKLIFDYLSYFFLFQMAFITTLGLVISPIMYVISIFFPQTELIFISLTYFSAGNLIPAIGLAISLIFCSLQRFYKIKWISVVIISGVLIQLVISLIISSTFGIWTNPLIIIYIICLMAAIWNLYENFNIKNGFKAFFKRNSKVIIHIGISFILIGTLSESLGIQDWVYFTGFFTILFGIIPSILVSFIKLQDDKQT